MKRDLCRHIYELGLFDIQGLSIWVLSYLAGISSNPTMIVKGFETNISTNTFDMAEYSKVFDGDLFWVLVDTLDINAEVALKACLS